MLLPVGNNIQSEGQANYNETLVFSNLRCYRSSAKHYKHPLPKVCVQHLLCKNGTQLYSYLVGTCSLCRIMRWEGETSTVPIFSCLVLLTFKQNGVRCKQITGAHWSYFLAEVAPNFAPHHPTSKQRCTRGKGLLIAAPPTVQGSFTRVHVNCYTGETVRKLRVLIVPQVNEGSSSSSSKSAPQGCVRLDPTNLRTRVAFHRVQIEQTHREAPHHC